MNEVKERVEYTNRANSEHSFSPFLYVIGRSFFQYTSPLAFLGRAFSVHCLSPISYFAPRKKLNQRKFESILFQLRRIKWALQLHQVPHHPIQESQTFHPPSISNLIVYSFRFFGRKATQSRRLLAVKKSTLLLCTNKNSNY